MRSSESWGEKKKHCVLNIQQFMQSYATTIDVSKIFKVGLLASGGGPSPTGQKMWSLMDVPVLVDWLGTKTVKTIGFVQLASRDVHYRNPKWSGKVAHDFHRIFQCFIRGDSWIPCLNQVNHSESRNLLSLFGTIIKPFSKCKQSVRKATKKNHSENNKKSKQKVKSENLLLLVIPKHFLGHKPRAMEVSWEPFA